ncbi:MAG: HEAT repeat domain-containing protein [Pseudomonadota bacterium]
MRFLVSLLFVFAMEASAQVSTGSDGWQSWRIKKQPGGGEMCCYRSGRKAGCELDGRPGHHQAPMATPDGQRFARIYARMQDDAVLDLHTFSDSCPVTTSTPINDLGLVDNADSVDWLSARISDRNLDEVLLAISVHAGDKALSRLKTSAQPGRSHREREQAIFWMAQHRGSETRQLITDVARSDPSYRLREHAVFALSQLGNVDGIDALTAVLADRSFPMNSRKQALFWLAQSDSDDAFAVIDGYLDP